MTKKQKNTLEKMFTTKVRVVDNYPGVDEEIDSSATDLLNEHEKEGYISERLNGVLKAFLYGFSADIQEEMADFWMDFACFHCIRLTNYCSVNEILLLGYMLIGLEQRILKPEFANEIINGLSKNN